MKKYVILVALVLIPVTAVTVPALTYFLGAAKALPWMPLALVVTALIAGRLIWKHRRKRGELPEHIVEHRPGSMHFQSLVHLDIPAEKLAYLCNQTLRLTAGRAAEPAERDGEFTATTPFNLRDWGQRIILHAENRGSETVVQIESRPMFKHAPPDQGKNARHVETAVEYLKRYERALAVGIE